MKRIYLATTRTMAALLATGCFALSAVASSNNGLHDVLSINLHDTGHAIVSLSGADNTEGCATPGHRTQILIDKADPRFKTMYATLLFAMGSGKKVSAWVSGCQDVWGDGSMRVPYARTLSVER